MPKIPITPPKRLGDEVGNTTAGVESLNFHFNQNDDGGFSLLRRGGLWNWWNSGLTNGVDGLYWWENKGWLVAVMGGRIFAFNALNCTPIEISTTDVRLLVNSPVQFETNSQWLFMTNKGRIVIWDGSASNTAQYMQDWPKAQSVAYLNTSILVDEYGTNRVRFTEPQPTAQLDIPEWSGEFFTPEANPDKLSTVRSKWGELLLFGPRSVEFWYYTGSGEVPFRRIEGAYTERGCSAPDSIVQWDNMWWWLDHEHKLVRLEGRTPKVISIPYDKAFRAINNASDARGFIVDQRFYVLTFPSDNYTIAYDIYSKAFSKWTFFNTETGLHERFLGQCSANVPEWNTQFIGSRRNGTIQIYHDNLVTDEFNPVRAEYLTAHIDWGTMNLKQSDKILLRLKRGA